MPVILPPEDYELWLDTDVVWLDTDVDEPDLLPSLLTPYLTEDMEAYPVSRRVNSPSNDEPDYVERVA